MVYVVFNSITVLSLICKGIFFVHSGGKAKFCPLCVVKKIKQGIFGLKFFFFPERIRIQTSFHLPGTMVGVDYAGD